MRKLCCSALLTAAAVALPAAHASAASQTVKGTGDIEKLVVSNAQTKLKASVFGIGAPCDDARSIKITVDWGTKAGYGFEGGCYGADWAASLVYYADRDAPEGGTLRECAKFRFTWDAAAKAHRAKVPRSCIPKAGNKVRVRAEGLNFASVTGGEAGPTKRLRRG